MRGRNERGMPRKKAEKVRGEEGGERRSQGEEPEKGRGA